MQYGHFDDANREYVITDPLPPRPWINYLGQGHMGAIVSQGAGGLAWFEQPVTRRLSRYGFMGLPVDRPGFYVYIRDTDGTVWNPSFQPSQTPLHTWECRQGLGTTRFLAERDGLHAELTFFVPPHGDVLYWDLRLRNERDEPARIFTCNYLEFSLFEFYKEILGWIVLRNQIRFLWDAEHHAVKYHYFCYEAPYTDPVWVTCSRRPDSFDCNRDSFIGRGRDTANPLAVEQGKLGNAELPGGGMGIASLGHDLEIAPGAEERIVWSVGRSDTWDNADGMIAQAQDLAGVDAARAALADHYAEIVDVMHVDFDDPALQPLINTWSPYGAYVTFFRERDVSTELPGLSQTIRFRDTMQQGMSMAHLAPDLAKPRLNLLLRHQYAAGNTPNAFWPGAKEQPKAGGYRCDSPVWSPITIYHYLAETGQFEYLDEEIPYLDKGSGTVYDHLMAGLRQIARDSGDNGLPLLKGRDWDDHLELFGEPGAESIMTAQNWCYAAQLMGDICLHVGRDKDAKWLDGQIAKYADALNGPAWDGEWYRQVLFRDGKTPLGSKDRRENKIYGNTQSWAIISGTAPADRARLSLDKMYEHLNTSYGIKFLIPPYTGIPEPEDPLVSNGPGLGENGGIFVQANCWAIMAEAMFGRGDRAWQYYRQVAPPLIADHVGPDVYLNEPYAFSSHIVCDPDPKAGMANLSWLTGTTSWMYVVATQYLLGIRPVLAGLRLHPCLPGDIRHVHVVRKYRGARYDITIDNAGGPTPHVSVDGAALDHAVIPVAPAGAEVAVHVCMG